LVLPSLVLEHGGYNPLEEVFKELTVAPILSKRVQVIVVTYSVLSRTTIACTAD
jgi:hypothetical protein